MCGGKKRKEKEFYNNNDKAFFDAGFESKPKKYVLSNGLQVKGKTLKKHQKN